MRKRMMPKLGVGEGNVCGTEALPPPPPPPTQLGPRHARGERMHKKDMYR